jgi:hypothetical protein
MTAKEGLEASKAAASAKACFFMILPPIKKFAGTTSKKELCQNKIRQWIAVGYGARKKRLMNRGGPTKATFGASTIVHRQELSFLRITLIHQGANYFDFEGSA